MLISTEIDTALLSLRNDMLLAADAGHGSAIVLVDLSAAFDTIKHDVLPNRLKDHCGLSGPVLSWFSSYLRGHTQAVAVGSALLQTTNIRFSVLLGSVLAGTLCTIYICQLPSATATQGVTIDGFSDDTQARIRLSLQPNGLSNLTSPLSSLSSWCLHYERFFLSNRVKFNIAKIVFFFSAPKSKAALPRSWQLKFPPKIRKSLLPILLESKEKEKKERKSKREKE